jgi:hypothetical protein
MSLDGRKLYPEDRFIYNGNAAGISAIITRLNGKDVTQIIPVQAASSLPTIGGRSEQITRGANYRSLSLSTALTVVREMWDNITHTTNVNTFLAFSTMRTFADGRYDPRRGHVTEVTATVEGLNVVQRRFAARRIHARLESVHPRAGEQPRITWEGSLYDHVTLDGYPLRITVNPQDELLRYPTEEELRTNYERQLRQRHAHRFAGDDPAMRRQGGVPRVRQRQQEMMFSIVEKIETDHPRARVQGHIVTLEEFGAIHFGEMLVGADHKRLIPLRMTLGCAYKGSLEFSIQDNGDW